MTLDPKLVLEMMSVMDHLAAGNMDVADRLAELGGPIVNAKSDTLTVVAQDHSLNNSRSI